MYQLEKKLECGLIRKLTDFSLVGYDWMASRDIVPCIETVKVGNFKSTEIDIITNLTMASVR